MKKKNKLLRPFIFLSGLLISAFVVTKVMAITLIEYTISVILIGYLLGSLGGILEDGAYNSKEQILDGQITGCNTSEVFNFTGVSTASFHGNQAGRLISQINIKGTGSSELTGEGIIFKVNDFMKLQIPTLEDLIDNGRELVITHQSNDRIIFKGPRASEKLLATTQFRFYINEDDKLAVSLDTLKIKATCL